MDQKIKTGLGTVILVIIALTAILFIWHYDKSHPIPEPQLNQLRSSLKKKNPVACTMEALQCPDGSYVSRTGPNCEFTPCPSTQIVGGPCSYDKVPGTCSILSVGQDETVKFIFAATDTLPDNPLATNLNGEHFDTLNILNDQNLSIKVGDKLACEAQIETKGTCTPVIFKFTGSNDEAMNDWQTYANKKYGYSVNYPGNWYSYVSDDADIFFQPTEEKPGSIPGPHADALEIKVSPADSTSTLLKIIKDELNGMDFSQEKFTIGGINGMKVASICDGLGCGVPEWFVLKNGYLFHFNSNLGYSTYFDKIIASFKFTKK
jgi:hypothetical protein